MGKIKEFLHKKKPVIMTREKLDALLAEKEAGGKNPDYEREILMKQANIAMLQGQINPHFLYNALECIRGQALAEGAGDIGDTTEALSSFFRYSINSLNDIVTLEDEIGHVQSYVTIQKYRFSNRFVLEVEYEEQDMALKNALIPKLTLQPLVENAIIHGLPDRRSGGIVCIQVKRTQSHLQIIVSDNGKGMDARRLEHVHNRLCGFPVQPRENGRKHTGLALENVNRRVQLLFGEAYGLSIMSTPGIGTEVSILLPFTIESGL